MAETQADAGPELLTVICTTYNHAAYIGRALEGFVRQRTDFRFVVLIGEDASTDGTADLVHQYAEKYPDRLRAFPRDRNLGMGANSLDLYQRIRSKYVAICEGDDYWTDADKLQKQVDFLETHPDYAVCFHPVTLLNEPEGTESGIFPDAETRFGKLSLTLDDLLKYNFIQTNSVVYRWRFAPDDPELAALISEKLQPGDHALHLVHAETGKIQCLDEVMAVYRRHPGGAWTGAGARDEWFVKWGLALLNFYAFKEKRFRYPEPRAMLATAAGLIMAALRAGRTAPIAELAAAYPGLYEKAVTTLGVGGQSGEIDKIWREGLALVRLRYRLLSKITRGRKKQRYQDKAETARRWLELLKALEDD